MIEKQRLEFDPRVKAWIEEEVSAQRERYLQIVREMEALAPERERWIEEFFHRIQTRGYNVHADFLRKIHPEELPKRPNRPLRVVF